MRQQRIEMTAVGWHQAWTVLVAGAIIMLLSAGSVSAALSTRSCGYTSPGYPVRVRASANVSCRQARHVMEVVFASHGYAGDACYAGYHFHGCTVQGFRCSEHGGAEFGHARCAKTRRRLIIGN
jgi:hypothetical protein